jgi:hypothetical protein
MKVREQQKAATGFHKQKEAKPSPQIEKQLTMGRMEGMTYSSTLLILSPEFYTWLQSPLFCTCLRVSPASQHT